MSEFENAEIAIQKSGRLTKGALIWLNSNTGSDFPVSEEPFDKRRELKDSATGIVVAGYSNGDTLKAVACGQTDLAICGSDKFDELMAPYNCRRVWAEGDTVMGYYPENNPFGLQVRLPKLGFGVCRMVLARPQSTTYTRPIESIVTSYPKLATLYMLSMMPMRNVRVDDYAGGIEMISRRGEYDVVVDIVESGDTLTKNDLTEVGTIGNCEALLVERKPLITGLDKPISSAKFNAAKMATALEVMGLASGQRSLAVSSTNSCTGDI